MNPEEIEEYLQARKDIKEIIKADYKKNPSRYESYQDFDDLFCNYMLLMQEPAFKNLLLSEKVELAKFSYGQMEIRRLKRIMDKIRLDEQPYKGYSKPAKKKV